MRRFLPFRGIWVPIWMDLDHFVLRHIRALVRDVMKAVRGR